MEEPPNNSNGKQQNKRRWISNKSRNRQTRSNLLPPTATVHCSLSLLRICFSLPLLFYSVSGRTARHWCCCYWCGCPKSSRVCVCFFLFLNFFVLAHAFHRRALLPSHKSATIFMAFGRNFNETLAHQVAFILSTRLHHWKLNYECDRKLTDFDTHIAHSTQPTNNARGAILHITLFWFISFFPFVVIASSLHTFSVFDLHISSNASLWTGTMCKSDWMHWLNQQKGPLIPHNFAGKKEKAKCTHISSESTVCPFANNRTYGNYEYNGNRLRGIHNASRKRTREKHMLHNHTHQIWICALGCALFLSLGLTPHCTRAQSVAYANRKVVRFRRIH